MKLDDAYARYRADQTTEKTLEDLLCEVRKFVYRRTHDADLAQELTLYVMEHLDSVRLRATFEQWLSGAIRHNRYPRRERVISFDEEALVPVFTTIRCYSLSGEAIVAALDSSSVEYQLADAILSGNTLRRAAHSLGFSETAARNRLRRLGHKLKKDDETNVKE